MISLCRGCLYLCLHYVCMQTLGVSLLIWVYFYAFPSPPSVFWPLLPFSLPSRKQLGVGTHVTTFLPVWWFWSRHPLTYCACVPVHAVTQPLRPPTPTSTPTVTWLVLKFRRHGFLLLPPSSSRYVTLGRSAKLCKPHLPHTDESITASQERALA